MSNHSSVTISATLAAELAQGTIDDINKHRQNSKDKVVKRRLESLNNGFFHKLFRSQDYTYEQVWKAEEAEPLDHWGNEFWSIDHMLYGEQMTVAERVLHASKLGTDVTLSIRDYERISYWK